MKKHSAVLTLVRNEHVMFPFWLRYYSKHFDTSDTYVIHNKDQDLYIPNNLTVYVERQEKRNHYWMAEVVTEYVHKLLDEYNYVLYAETDEIVIPLKYKNIKDYISDLDKKDILTISTTGYNLVHNYKIEPKLDINKPVLEQRRYVCRDNLFNKPLITAQPIFYSPGFHTAYPQLFNRDDNLWLLHLKSFDFDLSSRRQKDIYSNRILNDKDALYNLGFHNSQVDELFVKKMLFDDYLSNCIKLSNDFPVVI